MNDQPPNATKVDTSQGTVIAFASTEAPSKRQWTELVVYWIPCRDGRQFLADIVGKSNVRGHSTLRRPIYVGDLERALEHFDDSDLGDAVRLQARDWYDRNQELVNQAGRSYQGFTSLDDWLDEEGIRQEVTNRAIERIAGQAVVGFTGSGLGEALRWLYGEISEGGASMRLEIDFDVPNRTVRHALKQEADGRELTGWAKAFLKALRHFDRRGLAPAQDVA